MGLIVGTREQIDKYFASPFLSQSLLKKLIVGVQSYLKNVKKEEELFYTEKGHFIIGSAVDTILTGETGEFEKRFYVSTLEKKPTEVEMSIIQSSFFEIVTDNFNTVVNLLTFKSYENKIEQSILQHNWQANWKIETKIAKIVEAGHEYFEDLKLSHGKQILSLDDKRLIDNIVGSLINSSRTAKYFDRTLYIDNKNIDIYYQVPIYFKYKEEDCKALLDLFIVVKDNDGNILSVEPVDLKTMNGDTLKFEYSLKSFGYAIQAAWYTKALYSYLKLDSDNESKVKNFKFVVESNTFDNQPLIYELDKYLINSGENGTEDAYIRNDFGQFQILIKKGTKGFSELVDIYKYQVANNWSEDEVITKNDGVLKLGLCGIIN